MEQKIRKLVENAIAGDQEAFAALLEYYMKDILYWSTMRLNRQEAEDVAQEVAIVMFKQIHTLRDPDRFVYWVSTIVHNVSINYRKKLYKTSNIDIDNCDEEWLNAEITTESDMEFLPDRYAEAAELREIVMEEINKLPDNQRICLSYHCLYEFKRAEIAEVTGLSPRQVSTGLNYGKKTLKSRLEKRLGESFTYSVVPVGAIPALVQIMRSNQYSGVAAQWSAQVAKSCTARVSRLRPVTKGSYTTGAKVIGGAAAGTAAVGAAVFLALHPGPVQPVDNQATLTPVPVTTTEAVLPLQPTEKPIRTIADMIGEDEAALLEGFIENVAGEEQWETFLKRIGAQSEEVALELDCSYTIYQLEKQDKRLLLAEQKRLDDGTVRVYYDFDERSNEPVKMTQFILQFSLP